MQTWKVYTPNGQDFKTIKCTHVYTKRSESTVFCNGDFCDPKIIAVMPKEFPVVKIETSDDSGLIPDDYTMDGIQKG